MKKNKAQKHISLQISSSKVCNNNCIFCMEPRFPKNVNLDREFIYRMLKEYKNEAEEVMFVTKEPTLNPNLASYVQYAKKLFREAREKIGRTVDILVRDGLPSYDKSVKFLGRKCRSVVAGIKGRGIIHNKSFYWITNNPSESLNSEIDSYLAKFQYDFESLESANMFAKLFMLRRSLRRCFAAGELLETTSLLNQSIT